MANLGYIQLVRVCNQKCRFCSNPETDYVLTLEQARSQVDDFVQRGYDGIILTGGEPTLYEGLVEVIRYGTEKGIHVRMITNGQMTADREFTTALRDAGLGHVHISVHSHDAKLQAFLTGADESLANIEKSLDLFHELGINVDVNITIEAYNCGHLDGLVRWMVERWPFLHHFVFNNLDPSSDRVSEFPDTIPRLVDMEMPLLRALRYLQRSGRTFRVERVPLCYMVEFAWASTETRKIVKEEERIVHFLDEKGMVRQTSWNHGKADVCKVCNLERICAGLFEMDKYYSSAELYPVFVPLEPIIRRVKEEG
jgi:MoaA/NifB/PqqE/SkfB family radical SAM enzyme